LQPELWSKVVSVTPSPCNPTNDGPPFPANTTFDLTNSSDANTTFDLTNSSNTNTTFDLTNSSDDDSKPADVDKEANDSDSDEEANDYSMHDDDLEHMRQIVEGINFNTLPPSNFNAEADADPPTAHTELVEEDVNWDAIDEEDAADLPTAHAKHPTRSFSYHVFSTLRDSNRYAYNFWITSSIAGI
jgi:hypothetical protein